MNSMVIFPLTTGGSVIDHWYPLVDPPTTPNLGGDPPLPRSRELRSSPRATGCALARSEAGWNPCWRHVETKIEAAWTILIWYKLNINHIYIYIHTPYRNQRLNHESWEIIWIHHYIIPAGPWTQAYEHCADVPQHLYPLGSGLAPKKHLICPTAVVLDGKLHRVQYSCSAGRSGCDCWILLEGSCYSQVVCACKMLNSDKLLLLLAVFWP